jgi:hypothetical protein
MVPWQQAGYRKPDRIFATCDGGSKGSITEYRYGLKASIGLDLEYGAGMKQAWLLPFRVPSSLSGYLLLLSMPDVTTALLLPSDFSSAAAPAEGAIPYDLSSATLALVSSGHSTIQVTKKNIVLVSQHQKYGQPGFVWLGQLLTRKQRLDTMPGLTKPFECFRIGRLRSRRLCCRVSTYQRPVPDPRVQG